MVDLDPLVDVTAIVVTYFRAEVPALAALVDDGTAVAGVHAVRVPPAKTFPLLLVTVLDESSVSRIPLDRVNDATVQLEGFGATAQDEYTARQIVATAHASLRGLTTYDHPAGHVSAVVPETGLAPLPDNEHDKARWTATARVIAYPHMSPTP